MTRAYPIAGGIQAFGALTPIIPGRERVLQEHLHSLRDHSPFADVSGTHYARWFIVGQLPYDGPPQKPEMLKSQYLLFSACFDGTDLDGYLERLGTELGGAADAVWGHCVGYGGRADLSRYLLHNRIDPLAVFVEYPDASVSDVKAALARRAQLLRFVIDHQLGSDAATLRRHWVSEFGAGPRRVAP